MSVLQCTTLFEKDTPTIVLKSLFSKYDLDQNGHLDKEELYKLLKDDLSMTDEQAETYRHLLDRDGDSLVSFEEFQKWLLSGEKFRTINDKSRYHYLRRAVEMFRQYDTDGNLVIDANEFHRLFKESGGKGNKKEKDALQELDVDNNGIVSFQEFLKWLHWVPLEDLSFYFIFIYFILFYLFICNLFNVDRYTKLATDMYKINI